jgi:hypothetical protein
MDSCLRFVHFALMAKVFRLASLKNDKGVGEWMTKRGRAGLKPDPTSRNLVLKFSNWYFGIRIYLGFWILVFGV